MGNSFNCQKINWLFGLISPVIDASTCFCFPNVEKPKFFNCMMTFIAFNTIGHWFVVSSFLKLVFFWWLDCVIKRPVLLEMVKLNFCSPYWFSNETMVVSIPACKLAKIRKSCKSSAVIMLNWGGLVSFQ